MTVQAMQVRRQRIAVKPVWISVALLAELRELLASLLDQTVLVLLVAHYRFPGYRYLTTKDAAVSIFTNPASMMLR
jgi:hypothetical protein